ncbi:MAG: hypothetical protein EAZ85_04530 [Bacteroidetes bacterium]|nr:MAG: hypothetical protein EAZ85_04530 [Bacteroidota bacterium]TAG90722.1 MAG: hypothetical protein EAZ20_03810 [Bacteroidota bacterium]
MKKENVIYEPKWLSWENIKNTKKYQGKHLILGCEKNGLLLEVKLDVIYANISNEKVKNYWLKNINKIKEKNIYQAYGFRYVPELQSTKNKIIVSVRKNK